MTGRLLKLCNNGDSLHSSSAKRSSSSYSGNASKRRPFSRTTTRTSTIEIRLCRGIRESSIAAVLIAFSLLAAWARADTWTNAAGDTIEAEAVAFDGRAVVLRRPNGAELRLPLHSLADPEKQRVRTRFGGPEIPANVKPAYDLAARQIERARLLRAEGQMDDADYAERLEDVIGSFTKACAALSYGENSDQFKRWVTQLKR